MKKSQWIRVAPINRFRRINFQKGELMQKLIKSIREMHNLLQITKDFKKADEELNCYDVAHHLGLSLQEEYDMLILMQKRQRQEYLRLHFAKVIPMIAEMETLKVKVKQNGHFKNLKGFNFGA